MYTYQQKCTMNLSDTYTLLFAYLSKAIIDEYGIKGEKAVRLGTNRYGADRGVTRRKLHQSVGAKINMKHLFSLYPDLPGDPRFRREKQRLTEEERVSHTLVCPMADIWKAHNMMDIGRIYCEEFHIACYSTYAYGYTHVNLAKTLTQEGDEYCAFNVVLRGEDLPESLKKECFPKFDPAYDSLKTFPAIPMDGKVGFCKLSIKIYYYLLDAAVEIIGEQAIPVIEKALSEFALVVMEIFKESMKDAPLEIDEKFISDNFPIDYSKDYLEYWNGYTKHSAKEIFDSSFFEKLFTLIN